MTVKTATTKKMMSRASVNVLISHQSGGCVISATLGGLGFQKLLISCNFHKEQSLKYTQKKWCEKKTKKKLNKTICQLRVCRLKHLK